jgi:hypothetical protein
MLVATMIIAAITFGIVAASLYESRVAVKVETKKYLDEKRAENKRL